MKNAFYRMLISAFIICAPLLLWGQIQKQLKWDMLPSVPANKGTAGMYVGVSNGALLIMGGADLHNGLPWYENKSKSYDHLFILFEGSNTWQPVADKLPRPMAYGISISHNNQVILVGGCDGQNYYRDVYSVMQKNGEIQIDTLPSLPFPLAGMAGALVGDILFIAGGTTGPENLPTKTFLALNLKNKGKQMAWIVLESWPGPARLQAVGAAIHNDFFLFSGVELLKHTDSAMAPDLLKDAYRFVPAYTGSQLTGGSWKVLASAPHGIAGAPNPAPVIGLDHVLFPGGLRQGGPTKNIGLTAYNVETNTWLNFSDLPLKDPEILGATVKWNKEWVIINGGSLLKENSLAVFSLSKDLRFGWINWAALIIYLGLMLWIGFIYNKRGQTTNSFFTAGGKIPSWAAGLSIYGTQISAITFMAIPAIVFATDWSLAIGSVLILATVPIVVKYYIPFFRRLNVTSAYEYLEHRFSANVRLLGSLSFILFQMGRMGIVLYLPAVAIASVTGIDIYLLIVIMGIICIIYTVMGGIEAVVWTDVAQVIILFGGAVICFFVAVSNIEGGFQTVLTMGMDADKFTLFRLGWKPDDLVLWVCIVGFFFLNIIPYTSDQSVVQRYLTVKDEKQAAKSLWINAWVTLPGTLVFFGLGTVLYVFYHHNPGIIASDKVDEILPYFVVQQLPAGLSGLVIAGVFAASQSTLSSSMNSISASYFSDIYQRFNKSESDITTLKVARIVTIISGIFGTISAMLIVALDIQFAFDFFQEVLGILGGSLAGVFILGIFTKRANTIGVVGGLIAGVITVWAIRSNSTISVYLYGAISVMTCVIVGYLLSFIAPSQKGIEGFYYTSLKKNRQKKPGD